MPDALPADLQRLLDERAITEVLHRYCRGVDRLHEELLASAYHEDSHDDHGLFKGTGREFARFVVKVLREHADATQHCLTNVRIEVDGEVAHCESYVVARHWREREDSTRLETAGGRYIDRLDRRSGEWKIAHRVVVLEWGTVEEVVRPFPMEGYERGRRSRDDLSYRRPLP